MVYDVMEFMEKKFREMDKDERLEYIIRKTNLSEDSIDVIRRAVAAEKTMDTANDALMGENHIFFSKQSIGIAPKIIVNGIETVAPMLTEEPSVIAAASHGAKMTEKHGGFRVTNKFNNPHVTIGQIQLVGIKEEEAESAMQRILEHQDELIALANKASPSLVASGGGILEINAKKKNTRTGIQIIVDFRADCRDAMGANAVSKMAEAMAPEIERITNGNAVGRILSNLAVDRVVICEAVFDKDMLALKKHINGKDIEISGEEMIDRIVSLSAWAEADQFRATTHNKGIMNGITAVAMALGQDTRAIEAAAHSYAAYGRDYSPLSYFERTKDGNLFGRLEVPIPVGIIGGIIKTNKTVKACVEMTKCKSPAELAALIAAVGLAQNVSALRMLAGEGITSGHLPLHNLMRKSAEEKR